MHNGPRRTRLCGIAPVGAQHAAPWVLSDHQIRAQHAAPLIWLSVVNQKNSSPDHVTGGYAVQIGSKAYAGTGSVSRRLIVLIYAGWIPQDLSSSRSCLCLRSGVRQALSHRGVEDSPYVSLIPHMPWILFHCFMRTPLRGGSLKEALSGYRHVLGDGPHEGGEFSGGRRDDGVAIFPLGHQSPESSAQPHLASPGYIQNLRT